MSRAQMMAAIAKLEARNAARINQPVPDQLTLAVRLAALIEVADPVGPSTAENARACRAAQIVYAAETRRDADPFNHRESTR